MELRGWVIKQVIRQEKLVSEVLLLMFRILQNDSTKTLSNKSSSLSFKSKIDLLFDFGYLTKEEFSDFLKLMEIRNQFAHNYNCISFSALNKEDPSSINYLTKKFKLSNDPLLGEEEKNKKRFFALVSSCHKKLYSIKLDLIDGIRIEMEKYICYFLVRQKRHWIQSAQSKTYSKYAGSDKEETLGWTDYVGSYINFLEKNLEK